MLVGRKATSRHTQRAATLHFTQPQHGPPTWPGRPSRHTQRAATLHSAATWPGPPHRHTQRAATLHSAATWPGRPTDIHTELQHFTALSPNMARAAHRHTHRAATLHCTQPQHGPGGPRRPPGELQARDRIPLSPVQRGFGQVQAYPSGYRLLGLVVKASASRAEGPVFDSHLRLRDFSGSSHTSDFNIGTPVARRLGL